METDSYRLNQFVSELYVCRADSRVLGGIHVRNRSIHRIAIIVVNGI